MRLLGGVLAVALGLGPVCKAEAQLDAISALNAPAPLLIDDMPAVQDMFGRITTFREQGRYADAAALYQQIIVDHPRRLTPVEGDLYVDGRVRANNEIRADEKSLAAYLQLFSAEAERALAEALRPAPDVARLMAVVQRYELTNAGLDAALTLAAVSMERARVTDAMAVLDDVRSHPNIAAQTKRWHMLHGAAATYMGQDDIAAADIATLTALRDTTSVAALNVLASRMTPPLARAEVSPLDHVTTGKVPDRLIAPLWTVKLGPPDAAPFEGRPMIVRGPVGVNGVQGIASVANEHIYYNTGNIVSAIERYSGDVVWSFSETDVAARQPGDNFRRRTTRSMDLRGVAISDGLAVTILGGASRTPGMIGQPISETTLTALDAHSGSVRWTIAPRQLDDTLDDAVFHGTPLVADGRVYVMMRRIQAAGFQDAYVVGIDAATGSVLWQRYLASTAVTNMNAIRAMSQFTVIGGSLFVVDGLGTCSRIDGRTGSVQWLVKLPDLPTLMEMRQTSSRLMQPWAISTPTLTKAGLIVPSVKESLGAVVMNPANGKVIRKLDDEAWRSAFYFTAVDDDIVLVGPTIARVNGQTLSTKWSRRLGESSLSSPAGRAAITHEMLLLGTPESVATIRLSSGELAGRSNIRSAGNLVALDDQLVLVDDDSVQTYMDWDRAYSHLIAKVRDATADATPGLSLAHLALNARQREAAMEGIEAALTALTAMGTFHADEPDFEANYDRVFNRLLDLAQEPERVDDAMKRRLFEQLAISAITPRQRVDERFAEAQFLANSGAPEKAIDQYQSILFDQAMSQQLHANVTGARQAGLEAREQIAMLIEKHGRRIYQSYEDAAARGMSDLQASNAGAEAYIDLSRRFPLASSSTAAMLAGADRLRRDGRMREAIRVLHLAYGEVKKQPAIMQDVVGRLVAYNLQAKQPRQALRWLRQVSREHPDLHPLREGQPVAVADWIKDIEVDAESRVVLPSFSTPPGQPVLLEGRLLVPPHQRRDSLPADTLITLRGSELLAWDARTFEQRWTAELSSTQIELVYVSSTEVVVLADYERADATLTVLDSRTGKRSSEPLSLGEIARQIAPDVPQADQQVEIRTILHPTHNHARNVVMLNGRFVHGQKAEAVLAEDRRAYLAAANETVIVVTDRVGRMVAVDRVTGDVLWRMRCAFDRVEHLDLTDEALVLAGAMGKNDTILDGSLWVLDPVTAQPRMILQELGTVPSWVRVSEQGVLTYLVAGELVARYVGGGPQLWSKNNLPDATPTVIKALAGERLIYQPRPGYMRILNVSTGDELGDLQMSEADTYADVDLQAVHDQWLMQSSDQIVAFRDDGKVLWRDAIERQSKQLQLQLIGDQYVATVALRSGPVFNAEAVGQLDPRNFRPGGGLLLPVEEMQANRVARGDMRAAAVNRVEGNLEPPAGHLGGVGRGGRVERRVAHQPLDPPLNDALERGVARANAEIADVEMQVLAQRALHQARIKAIEARLAQVAQPQAQRAEAEVLPLEGGGVRIEVKARDVADAEQAQVQRAEVRRFDTARRGMRDDEEAELVEAIRRAVAERQQMAPQNQPVPVQLAQADADPADAQPAGYTYTLYLMHRDGGLMVVETSLPVLAVPLDPTNAVFIRDRIVLTTSRQTIVIPSADAAAPE